MNLKDSNILIWILGTGLLFYLCQSYYIPKQIKKITNKKSTYLPVVPTKQEQTYYPNSNSFMQYPFNMPEFPPFFMLPSNYIQNSQENPFIIGGHNSAHSNALMGANYYT